MKISFDKSFILKVSSNSDVYNQARLSCEKGDVTLLESIQEKNINIIKAHVDDYNRPYFVYLIFDFNGVLSEYKCNCNASGIWRGACKHVGAVLFRIYNDSVVTFYSKRQKNTIGNFLKSFEELDKFADITLPPVDMDEPVTLLPTLCLSPRGDNGSVAALSFTIGMGRMYILRDIDEFLSGVQEHRLISYGKNCAFVHSPEMFDDDSRVLLEFIQEQHENYNHIANSLPITDGTPLHFSRYLHLTPRSLDDFFSLYKDCSVKVDLDDGLPPSNLPFVTDKPLISFDVSDDDGKISISGRNSYSFYRGATYSYAVASGDSIYQISHEYADIVSNISSVLTDENKYKLTFDNTEIGGFLSLVLPKLKKHGLTTDTGVIDVKYKIHELAVKIYLDLTDGVVTLRGLFCYGDIEISILGLGTNRMGVFRNVPEENRFRKIIENLGFSPDSAHIIYTLKNNDKIFYFYKSGLPLLRDIAEVYATDEFTQKAPRYSQWKGAFGVRVSGNLLEIRPESSDYNIMDLISAISAFNVRKKYYRLKDGSFINLDGETIEEAASFINALDVSDRDVKGDAIVMPSYKALYVDSLMDDLPSAYFDRDGAFNKLTQDFANFKDNPAPIPESLSGILRNYQKDGFKWLASLSEYGFGGILADDMGLGKTIQVISLMTYYAESGIAKAPHLIVAPTSLIYNWEKEFQKFSIKLNIVVVAGVLRLRQEIFEQPADVYITTYDLLKRDIALYRERSFHFIIADEAQNIKNPGTQNARAIKDLKSECRFALTGTPIENSLSELWSIFDFIMPGYLYNASKFARQYESPIIKNNDQETATRLKKQIAPFILRRLKRDVLSEIPDKLETTLYAEMSDGQKKIYTAYLMKARGDLDGYLDNNMFSQSQIEILSYITRLRQICCHPALFMDNYKEGSGKLDIAMETIQNCLESGHRILLFSQFTSVLDIVRREIEKIGISYYYLDGSTSSINRLEMSESFNNGERDIFLISLKAGGVGLNLTGADVVIHFDPWWNPAVMDQASDRAHRIGQKKVVQIFNIVAKDSIEQKILDLQTKKKSLIDMVIQDNAGFLKKMTEDDIRELFS